MDLARPHKVLPSKEFQQGEVGNGISPSIAGIAVGDSAAWGTRTREVSDPVLGQGICHFILPPW